MTVIITLLTIILSNKMTKMRIGANFIDMGQKLLVFVHKLAIPKLIIDTFCMRWYSIGRNIGNKGLVWKERGNNAIKDYKRVPTNSSLCCKYCVWGKEKNESWIIRYTITPSFFSSLHTQWT